MNGYQVRTPHGTRAKSTSKAKAMRQANLLRAIEHGWKPTGKLARDIRRKKKRKGKGLYKSVKRRLRG